MEVGKARKPRGRGGNVEKSERVEGGVEGREIENDVAVLNSFSRESEYDTSTVHSH